MYNPTDEPTKIAKTLPYEDRDKPTDPALGPVDRYVCHTCKTYVIATHEPDPEDRPQVMCRCRRRTYGMKLYIPSVPTTH